MSRALALAVGFALASPALGETHAPTVEYFHVGASEGSSLGGHAALRAGDHVFHFQHRPPGVLVLDRTDPDTFRWQYGTIQNRTIRTVGLPASEDDTRRLQAHLGRLYVAQQEHLAIRDALEEDRRLFTRLARTPNAAAEPVSVRGAAAFFPDGARIDPIPVARAADSERWLPDRHDTTAASLPTTVFPGVPIASPGTVCERYEERLQRLVALDVLAHDRHVRPERLRVIGHAPPLSATERTALHAFRERLEGTAARLPHSNRPDWALAFLVTRARLDATTASLARGRLVVVDAPGALGERLADARSDDRDYAREVARGARRLFADIRAATIATGVLDERSWSRLEHAGLRMAASRPGAGPARALPLDASPTAPALLSGLPSPHLGPEAARRALSHVEGAIDAWDATLARAYGYDLLRANCVTALVDVLGDTGLAAISRRKLGPAGFVPRVSFDRIAVLPGVGPVRHEPSHRRRRLADMETHESRLRVRLREDNVLTSTLRRRTQGQPAFLFFTDASVVPRPLYGAANFGIASLQASAGLLGAPFDRARQLRLGLRGIVASVPELAFLSVRTGRFRYDHADIALAP